MTESAAPDPRGGPREQVPALTGFRALAAAMVFFGHAAVRWGQDHTWLVKYGWTGVNLFFALSGFLFTRLYFDDFAAGTVPLRDYFLKRVFRVLPLTWLLVLVTVATMPYVPTAVDIVTHLTLTHVYLPDYRFTLNPPMWTLCVEESFYLVVPALFLGLGAVERARPAASPAARVLAVGLCLLLLVEAGVALTTDALTLRRAALGTWDHGLWALCLPARFSDFACGILAGLVALRFPAGRWRAPVPATALVALGVALWYVAVRWMERHGGQDAAGAFPAYQLFSRLFAAGGALAILGLHGRSWLTPLFASRPMVYAGRISFALYLSQDAVLGSTLLSAHLARFVHRFVAREGLALLCLYALHSLVAAALHHGVEDPAQRHLRRRFLRAARGVTSPPTPARSPAPPDPSAA